MAHAQQSVAEQVKAKAELAVKQFQGPAGGTLNYTEASLERIEALLNEASHYHNQMNERDRSALIELMGCYVLQVAQVEFSGEFLWHQDLPILVVGEPVFHVALFPFAKVRGRLSGDKGDNIPFFYQGFAQRARTREPGTRALYI
jgi:hypothetical protein